jgi:hypothetical protein
MRRALPILTALAALTTVSAAAADRSSLGMPRILSREPALPKSVIGAAFFAPRGIFDLKAVQDHPEMRARMRYSLMAALPELHAAPAAKLDLPLIGSGTKIWKLSESLQFSFPLAITGRNLVTADIAGAGRIAIAPYGAVGKGGVFTFSGAF